MSKYVLEPEAQQIADATANPPYLYEIGPEAARKVLDDIQAQPVELIELGSDEWHTVPAEVGDVRVRLIKPKGVTGPLPVILYMHGGGWILGNAGTHDRLVRELADGAHAALVFVEYDRSPEARYPVAIEQGYAAAQWILAHGAEHDLDTSRVVVAGDSVGGDMTAALTLMAKQRGDVTFLHQLLFYPVTDAGQDTESYAELAEGPFLRADAMAWFWDAYIPQENAAQRREITASPLQATLEDLQGLPPALVITDDDVLRDEGRAYAAKLTAAGVPTVNVHYAGVTHDFMMLNPERPTQAATAAVEQAIQVLRKALGTLG
jgi:acetyl esterase